MKNLFQEFNRIDGCIDKSYHKAALRMGLSDGTFWILYTLAVNEPGCMQAALCRATGMTRTTVNSALKKLEKDGILYLTSGEGRNTRVFLTEKGTELVQNTVCRLIELENRIYEGWSPEEQVMLLRLNRDFADKLTALVETL